MNSVTLLLAVCALSPAVADETWQGNWDSNYGQIRLLQDGVRVWGDYAERGTLEGIATADGSAVRGVFVYTSGKWGTFEFRRQGDAFDGHWRWSEPTQRGDKGWMGQKTSATPDTLKYATRTGPRGWPQDVDPAGALLGRFLSHEGAATVMVGDAATDGRWYGGYALDVGVPTVEIQISLDQVDNGKSGFADLYVAVLSPDFECPDGMHPGFCQELKSYASGVTVPVQDLGVQYQDDTTARLALALGSDTRSRLLEISQGATGVEARLYHPERGLDMMARVRRGPHACEEMQCLADRLTELVAAPDTAGLGLFAGGGFMAQFKEPKITSLDLSTLDGVWQIFDETSEPLGRLRLAQAGDGINVEGVLQVHPFASAPAEQRFEVAHASGAVLDIAVRLFADGSGEQAEGRILMDAPTAESAVSQGSLFVGDDVFVVEFVRQDATSSLDDQSALGDTPGFGIYRFYYALEGVPEGKSLAMRAGPSRDTAQVGALRADARDILLLECTPEPDNIAFDSASVDVQRQILSSRWCKAQSGETAGYVPGLYLVPVPQ